MTTSAKSETREERAHRRRRSTVTASVNRNKYKSSTRREVLSLHWCDSQRMRRRLCHQQFAKQQRKLSGEHTQICGWWITTPYLTTSLLTLKTSLSFSSSLHKIFLLYEYIYMYICVPWVRRFRILFLWCKNPLISLNDNQISCIKVLHSRVSFYTIHLSLL